MPAKNLVEKVFPVEWKCKVSPIFKPDDNLYGVWIDEWEEFHGEIRDKRGRFINLQEEQVRKALIALGWTPPENEEMLDV